jgi:hypothetical protein
VKEFFLYIDYKRIFFTMNLTEISFKNLKVEIETYLRQEHSKANILYSVSSPYGQILSVLENLFQLSLLYLKNSIKQFDLLDPSSVNARAIKNAAIFAGHIPSRHVSATGALKFTIKTNVDIQRDIPGGRLNLFNKSALKNKTNGLEYALNLGGDRLTFNITNNTQFFIAIIQGRWNRKFFTGNGNENQTLQVSVRGLQEIENFNYEVLVNGEIWTTKKHIYELIPDDKACVVRTGFNNGIDIIFGNGAFGAIPQVGAVIEVNYLVSDGSAGSIFRRTLNDWTFIDQATDGFGDSLDLSDVFDISIATDINFGSDKETTGFTKSLLPISSNNFVLGLPEQYAYHIKRLGVFSHVNAYEEFGTLYIVATPNIKLFRNGNGNYFTVNRAAFELDDYEKNKIDQYLRAGGNIMLTKNYIINSPILSYYIINVFIITYSDAQDDAVNSQIHDTISEYFLNFNRLSRVPKSDLVSQLSIIKDIHSVDISFICKKNEDYHKENKIQDENRNNAYATRDALKISRPNPNYNPKASIGLDPVLGDIVFEPDEIPVIRGGWYDRDMVYFSADIEEKGLKSVNIIKKGSVDASARQKI